MLTVAETAVFVRYAAEVWSDAEREAFISWIAANPSAGDVIPGSGGCRKVRWTRQGQGKRGGARVIYFVASGQTIWLLIVYAKAKFDNLPAEFLAEELERFKRDLLKSVKQMRRGEAARVTRVKVPEAAEARSRTGLSQEQFARLLGVSARTLQDWEQGRREPTGAAKTLLRVAYEHPEVLLKLER